MTWNEHPQTYDDAMGNLTAENWHRERALIEAEVERLRAVLGDVVDDYDRRQESRWGASCSG